MDGDEAITQPGRDPALLASVAEADAGADALAALQRLAADPDASIADVRAALYRPGLSESDRRALAARLEAGLAKRDPVATAVDVATAKPAAPQPTAPQPDAPRQDAQATEPEAAASARSRRRPIRMAGGAAVLLALLIGAFGAGRATAPAPVRAASPVPISLPTVLPVVEHDGEMARIAWGAHASDPRTIAVRLPAMRHGWSLATACLARDPHPRVLPTQTVLLFDDLDLQLISRTVRCDAVERDFIAIVGPAAPASVRMVLVLDPLTVRSGWVSLVPTQR